MKAEQGKIAVGMSGGVDSSVAALLLQKAGYEVVGITMLLKPEKILSPEERENRYREAEDARAVCDRLGIPHYMPDFSEMFEEKVIRYFAEEYFSGRTPNPCLMCNRNLKFGLMLDYALSLGCDAVSTGHYARVEKGGDRWLLKRAHSPKDQSYFLYGLTQHQLSHTLFPLQVQEKAEARRLAAEAGLPVAQKPDSQDICFVKNNGYTEFIESYTGRTAPSGDFVDENGAVLGSHSGIYRYTVGQRKGLGIAFGEPRYVTGMDAGNNTVTLGPEGSQYRQELLARDLNFIPFDRLTGEMEVTAKVRYRAPAAAATIIPQPEGQVLVRFQAPQRSVTPGQAVVFYQGDTVVGGGIII